MNNVLVLWTGGLDSTYLIIKNLFLGNKVHLGYINIANNENCMLAEKQARTTLLKYIKKLISKIDFDGELWDDVKELCCIQITGEYDYSYPQVPLFFPAIVNSIFSYDEIQMGYVKGDYIDSNIFLDKFSNIYNSYIDLVKCEIGTHSIDDNTKIAKLTFPLSNTIKQEEILFLKSLDNKYKTKFLNTIIHCENVQDHAHGVYTNCNECDSCNNYKAALDKLDNKEIKKRE